MFVCITDSVYCIPKTNIVNQLYPNKIFLIVNMCISPQFKKLERKYPSFCHCHKGDSPLACTEYAALKLHYKFVW